MDDLFKDIHLGDYQEVGLDLKISPFEVFKRLYPYFNNIFLLESLGEEGKYNRFSYIGFDPLLIISAHGNSIIVNGRLRNVENPYHVLSQFAKLKSQGKGEQAGYCGGLVGYVSHEGTSYFEPAFVGHQNLSFPNFEFGFFQDGLKIDKKVKRSVYFHYGNSRIKQVVKLLNRSGKLGLFQYRLLSGGKGEKEHAMMVKRVKEHIVAGDIFQAVLSLKNVYQLYGDLRKFYAVLRQINPSPYMIYMKFGERKILSASPELLVRVRGKEIEHFGTLAGTIRTGLDRAEDEKLTSQLMRDEKEVSEHMMLVDLARNDVGKICDFGSVIVKNLATVRRFSFVHHLYSEVHGILRDGENSFTALSACFPAGTLTGAPKIEAMKIITRLESDARGPYGGVGGYFSLNGEAMLAILIRSLFVKGQEGYTQTGSGIVLDSTPAKEYQEVLHKQKAMEEALRFAQGKPPEGSR